MCENKNCGVHYRVNAENRETEYDQEFITKITYTGEWAVFTDDNSFLMTLLAMQKGLYPHMTLVVKVGTQGTLGDTLKAHPGLKGVVYDAFFDRDIDKALNSHDMVVYGIESGIFEYDKPCDPNDVINNL